jgi:capsular polysaccharide export protein
LFNLKNKQNLILKKVNNFFSKKIPKGDKYPYNIYSTFEVIEKENTGYEGLYLIGDNWKNYKDKPIAIILGCNDWKFGFISEYLKDYRCAFGARKLNGFKAIQTITKLKIKPEQIIIWGYNENRTLSFYLRNKKIWRLEDGFVRSSALGASHSTPYSLVLDKTGFYYNCHNPSDIENLLNNYNFSEDTKLLEKANIALETLLSLKISKYNPPILHKDNSIKIKKTIAVLGQVDGDASIKYGNINKITSKEMLILAREENPHAKILYRPHPEVFKGYQKSKLKSKEIEIIATLCSPDEDIIEFIERVDHVYTITSLTGLEALLRNKKVTVLGSPFYSGWGLTDDRVQMKRRTRNLTLLELFTGIYLLYPKYLAELNDPFIGFMSACFKIKAEREIETHDYFNQKYNEESFAKIVDTKYFVKLFFSNNQEQINANFLKTNFTFYLNKKTPVLFEKIYLLSIIGVLKDEDLENRFLFQVRSLVEKEVFHDILLLLNKYFKKSYLINQILWLNKHKLDFDLDNSLIYVIEKNNPLEIIKSKEKIDIKDIIKDIKLESLKLDFKLLLENKEFKELNELITFISKNVLMNNNLENILLDYYNYHMEEKEFDIAFSLAEIMLLNNIHTKTMLYSLTIYSKLRFDFNTTRMLAELNQNIDLYALNRNMALTEMNTYGSKDIENIGEDDFNCKLAKLIALKSNAITSTSLILNKYKHSDIKLLNNILESTLYLDNEQSIRKAQSFISIGKADFAVTILENIINNKVETTPNLIIAYTQALSFDNKLDTAICQIKKALKNYTNKNIFEEAIRLHIIKDDYPQCLKYLENAISNNIDLAQMYKIKTYQGNRLPQKTFNEYKYISPKIIFEKYYPIKYLNNLNLIEKNDIVSIFAIHGPGDEIRFASFYNNYLRKISNTKIYITCTPKLLNLFSRSFINVTFIPVERLRDLTDTINSTQYTNLKASDLVFALDNNGVKLIEKSTKIFLATDFIGDFIKDYDSFNGIPYLNEELKRKDYYKKLLPNNKKLVGLSWRSSLTTHSRNEHYLTIQELEPLFKIDNIQFVNFQYDDCSEELDWVEKRYPGKIINIQELDQYDDLDGVAALLKCMDLVIAPATTVIELAGALGCETWMFSNSSEIDWRKIDDEGTDVWHNSIKIVDTDEKGNKKLLVDKIYKKLLNYSNDKK